MTPCRRMLACMMAAVSLAVRTDADDAALRLPPYPLGPVVMLADGGIVAGRLTVIEAESVVIDSLLLGRIDLPRASVVGYRASMAVGPVPPQRLDATAGEAAVVRLVNGDSVVASGLTALANELKVSMAAPVPQDVVIPLDVVRAIDFTVAAVKPTLPRRLVALADGSRFVEACLPEVCDPADVVATLVDGGEMVLLPRLEPLAYEQGDAAVPDRPLMRGSTLAGDWLSARGTTAYTGLGMQAPARVRYRLAAPADRFAALVAIDDSAGQEAGVIAWVRAIDAAGTLRDVHVSPILWADNEPHAISVNLGGAVELEIGVDPADGTAGPARTTWLDPRVVSVTVAE